MRVGSSDGELCCVTALASVRFDPSIVSLFISIVYSSYRRTSASPWTTARSYRAGHRGRNPTSRPSGSIPRESRRRRGCTSRAAVGRGDPRRRRCGPARCECYRRCDHHPRHCDLRYRHLSTRPGSYRRGSAAGPRRPRVREPIRPRRRSSCYRTRPGPSRRPGHSPASPDRGSSRRSGTHAPSAQSHRTGSTQTRLAEWTLARARTRDRCARARRTCNTSCGSSPHPRRVNSRARLQPRLASRSTGGLDVRTRSSALRSGRSSRSRRGIVSTCDRRRRIAGSTAPARRAPRPSPPGSRGSCVRSCSS